MSVETLDEFLAGSAWRRWFTLDELAAGILNHVVEADAEFQMRQRETWKQIAESFEPLERLEQLAGISFTAGLDRLDNLGLSEFEIEVDVRAKQIRWYSRVWRRLRPSPKEGAIDPRYKLMGSRRCRGRIRMRWMARRTPAGGWDVARVT